MEIKDYRDLKRLVVEWRIDYGLNQGKIAEKLGIGISHFSSVLSGKQTFSKGLAARAILLDEQLRKENGKPKREVINSFGKVDEAAAATERTDAAQPSSAAFAEITSAFLSGVTKSNERIDKLTVVITQLIAQVAEDQKRIDALIKLLANR